MFIPTFVCSKISDVTVTTREIEKYPRKNFEKFRLFFGFLHPVRSRCLDVDLVRICNACLVFLAVQSDIAEVGIWKLGVEHKACRVSDVKNERLNSATVTARRKPLETQPSYAPIAPYDILVPTSLRKFVLHAAGVWHRDLWCGILVLPLCQTQKSEEIYTSTPNIG